MIELTSLRKETFYLNPDLIETIEKSPDTIISTTTGKKFFVTNSPDEIGKKIIKFKQKIYLEKFAGLDVEV